MSIYLVYPINPQNDHNSHCPPRNSFLCFSSVSLVFSPINSILCPRVSVSSTESGVSAPELNHCQNIRHPINYSVRSLMTIIILIKFRLVTRPHCSCHGNSETLRHWATDRSPGGVRSTTSLHLQPSSCPSLWLFCWYSNTPFGVHCPMSNGICVVLCDRCPCPTKLNLPLGVCLESPRVCPEVVGYIWTLSDK